MNLVVKIFSPLILLIFSLCIFSIWTSNCSSYTTYSYALKKAGTTPYKAPKIKLINKFREKLILGACSEKYTLVNFIYLNCPHACPISVLKMRNIIQRSNDDFFLSNLSFLSVSFDPKRDSIKKINIFWQLQGKIFQWDIAVIDENSEDLEKKFAKLGVWAKYDRLKEFSHTNFFFLLDRSGRVVQIFFPEQKIENILKIIKKNIKIKNGDE